MREIKFRAWDNKKECFTDYQIMDDFILFFEKHNGCWLSNKENRFELMQYTGLNDKNGNEIYEGDILLSSNENGIFLQLIGFGDDDREYSGILNGFKIIDGRILEGDDYEIDECKEFTQELIKAHNIPILQPENTIIDGWWIVGNIYENPELLENNND